MSTIPVKAHRGMGMGGWSASWYASITRKSLDEYKALARRVAPQLRPGAAVLDLAPGPGFFAVELARLGGFRVCGLDISRNCVEIAREEARQAGVQVDFRLGNAAAMPYGEGSFDFILCRAAFKNFSQPLHALREMRRVLSPGGTALIIDLRRDVSSSAIREAVAQMRLGSLNAFLVRRVFRHMLVRRAYTRNEFEQLVAQAGFRPQDVTVEENLIGLELRLCK